MEKQFTVEQIGVVRTEDGSARIELAPAFRGVLEGLVGFSHIQILWWFSGCDNESDRRKLTEDKPYTKGPDWMGVFATRSPQRPNPIALSCAYVTACDVENGIVHVAYLDAYDQSTVLDIKPYTPSLDRVEQPEVPQWCAHWPDCVEESGDFDWENEFLF